MLIAFFEALLLGNIALLAVISIYELPCYRICGLWLYHSPRHRAAHLFMVLRLEHRRRLDATNGLLCIAVAGRLPV